MSLHQENQESVSTNSTASTPPFSRLFVFLLLLAWLAAAPVAVGLVKAFLPFDWPDLAAKAAAAGLTAGLLLVPAAGFVWLVDQRDWPRTRPLALALLMTALYITVALIIRTATNPDSPAEAVWRLLLLTVTALGLGTVSLRRAGAPAGRLALYFGLGLPGAAGLLLALALIALLSFGWPLTGALGDSWTSLLIAVRTLALTLPQEILFRGAIVGLLLYHFPQRKGLVVLAALFIYLAFTPSMVIPHNDWGNLLLLITAIPFTLLAIELRILTGTIWPGLLFVWAYRAAPLLFTDPRVELPLITQPWQTAARLWQWIGVVLVILVLWAAWRWLAGRGNLSALARAGLMALVALLLWAGWLGLWVSAGQPGFYDDGFLIVMSEQADLSDAEEVGDIVARRAFVRGRLIETAERTQPPVLNALDAAGLSYRSFYIINMIRVDGHHRRMAEFSDLPGVAAVILNPNVRPYPYGEEGGYGATPEDQGIGWNIRQTRADQVWSRDITGQGIVVGGQDTGYDWQHPALRRAYRGYNSEGTPDHNYNWHDAWTESPVPFDDGRHGTHTMGTILGDDGAGNQIGMAPGARWIGCRNMRRGLGNPASYAECMEFFLAPYPLGGDPFTDGDVSLAPHVTNNSWGCPDIEGCTDEILEPGTGALRAAGIMVVASAGNDGPACQTVSEPPARYDNVFSIGATDELGAITGFSSRGPVLEEADRESLLLKPDVTAPGDNIRSSVPGGGYGAASGTSMAGPHVTGLIALLWSANPNLIGRVDRTEELIRRSARPVPVTAACPTDLQPAVENSVLEELAALSPGTACACGDVTGSPNNIYGWGEIDALAAIRLALEEE